MNRKICLLILLLVFSSGCLEPPATETPASPDDPDVPPAPRQEVWDLVSSGCNADTHSPPATGPAIRLTLGESTAKVKVSPAAYPIQICITEERVSRPTAQSIRFIDGAISCRTSSGSYHYPWGDGPDDVTFKYFRAGSALILSKPAGDAGCNSVQSFNYVFQLIAE